MEAEKIPVVEKDFIFAAISEEMGAVFALCLLLICLGCFLQFMMMACKMQALFYKLIAFGFGMLTYPGISCCGRSNQIHSLHRSDTSI